VAREVYDAQRQQNTQSVAIGRSQAWMLETSRSSKIVTLRIQYNDIMSKRRSDICEARV
jgi:hypothetical protein